MNIRRFTAENSRSALRQVREALGGDAIILANRSIEGGVEVLAAAPDEVEALTRRMSVSDSVRGAVQAPHQSSVQISVQAPAPTLAQMLPIQPGVETATPRHRLASLFARRTATTAPSAPASAAIPASTAPSIAPAAANAYADDYAAELDAALENSASDAVVARLAPEAVALAAAGREETPVINRQPILAAAPAAVVQPDAADALPVTATAAEIAVAVAPIAPVAQAAPVSSVDISEAAARDVSRELGRDVVADVTRDVTREVTRAVTHDVSLELTRDMTREIRAMQAALSVQFAEQFNAQFEEKFASLSWTEAMRRQPGRAKLMQELIVAGFSPSLARHIQERLPDDFSNGEARDWAQAILRRNLPVASDAEELINQGGVYALVGPTGVGKTTTVAKLAARFALTHGVDQLALITTDGFRIGAQDQLRIYGKILGVAVHSIHDRASLSSAIAHLTDKKLVLIDTAGLGQRDERVAEQIAMLAGAKAKRVVVLNATADAETLDHVVATFADREFAGCVITKTDEAARLAPVLDAAIRHRLKIHHVSNGQKVPEDLERPDVSRLVEQALTRPAPPPAFELDAEDQPAWMTAMAARARPLDLILATTEAGHA